MAYGYRRTVWRANRKIMPGGRVSFNREWYVLPHTYELDQWVGKWVRVCGDPYTRGWDVIEVRRVADSRRELNFATVLDRQDRVHLYREAGGIDWRIVEAEEPAHD